MKGVSAAKTGGCVSFLWRRNGGCIKGGSMNVDPEEIGGLDLVAPKIGKL